VLVIALVAVALSTGVTRGIRGKQARSESLTPTDVPVCLPAPLLSAETDSYMGYTWNPPRSTEPSVTWKQACDTAWDPEVSQHIPAVATATFALFTGEGSDKYKQYPVWRVTFSGGDLCVINLSGLPGAPSCAPNEHYAIVIDASKNDSAGQILLSYTSTALG
jgi:hypothetical protein